MGGRIEFRDLVMNYTTPHNLIGLPSCSVAIGIGTDGIPIGVQVTARHGNEEVVLKVAASFAEAAADAVAAC